MSQTKIHRRKNLKSLLNKFFFLFVLIFIFSSIYFVFFKKEPLQIDLKNPQKDIFTFSFVGDYGATPNTKKVLELINQLNPTFHLALGDLKYTGTKTEHEWCDFVKTNIKKVPFILLSGNHESDGKDGSIEKFIDCFPFPLSVEMKGIYAKNYFFDYPAKNPQVRFIFISPNIHFKEGQVEYEKDNPLMKELVGNIKDAKQKSIPWVVVAAHKPCFSTEIFHTCETGADLPKEIVNQGVDLYINGHTHIYERTFMLSCVDENQIDERCIHKGEAQYFQKGQGTIFVTSGTGGVPIRESKSNSKFLPYVASNRSGKNNPVFGTSLVRVRKDELEFNFFNAQNGQLIDYFIIKKDGTH